MFSIQTKDTELTTVHVLTPYRMVKMDQRQAHQCRFGFDQRDSYRRINSRHDDIDKLKTQKLPYTFTDLMDSKIDQTHLWQVSGWSIKFLLQVRVSNPFSGKDRYVAEEWELRNRGIFMRLTFTCNRAHSWFMGLVETLVKQSYSDHQVLVIRLDYQERGAHEGFID